jgi:hypothetical protein
MGLADMPFEAVLIGKAHSTVAAFALKSSLGFCPNFREGLRAGGIPVLCVSAEFRKLSLDGRSSTPL